MDQPRPRRLGFALRWAGTAAGIAYVAHLIDPAAVRHAAARISPAALAAAVALVAGNVVAGAARWRQLLAAYGAERRPAMRRAIALYFVSFFYNNYLPGAVTGDVVRGVVTRDVFGERGATAGIAVVLVERALGLTAVFGLLALGVGLAGSTLDTGSLWLWSGVGLAGAAGIVLSVPFARRLAPRLTHASIALGRIAARMPELAAVRPFVAAVLFSFVTQGQIVLAGWVLLHAVAPQVGIADALLLVPLAAATQFLPITVGGAGAREAVFVVLGAKLFGIARADALAASLALWLANLLIGGAGGLVQLATRE